MASTNLQSSSSGSVESRDYRDLEISVSYIPEYLRKDIASELNTEMAVAKNWRDLAEQLGYIRVDIKRIIDASSRDRHKSETILLLEDYETRDGATVAKLARALDTIGRPTVSAMFIKGKEAILQQYNTYNSRYQSLAPLTVNMSHAIHSLTDSVSSSYTDMNIYEHPLPVLSMTHSSELYISPTQAPSIHPSQRPQPIQYAPASIRPRYPPESHPPSRYNIKADNSVHTTDDNNSARDVWTNHVSDADVPLKSAQRIAEGQPCLRQDNASAGVPRWLSYHDQKTNEDFQQSQNFEQRAPQDMCRNMAHTRQQGAMQNVLSDQRVHSYRNIPQVPESIPSNIPSVIYDIPVSRHDDNVTMPGRIFPSKSQTERGNQNTNAPTSLSKILTRDARNVSANDSLPATAENQSHRGVMTAPSLAFATCETDIPGGDISMTPCDSRIETEHAAQLEKVLFRQRFESWRKKQIAGEAIAPRSARDETPISTDDETDLSDDENNADLTKSLRSTGEIRNDETVAERTISPRPNPMQIDGENVVVGSERLLSSKGEKGNGEKGNGEKGNGECNRALSRADELFQKVLSKKQRSHSPTSSSDSDRYVSRRYEGKQSIKHNFPSLSDKTVVDSLVYPSSGANSLFAPLNSRSIDERTDSLFRLANDLPESQFYSVEYDRNDVTYPGHFEVNQSIANRRVPAVFGPVTVGSVADKFRESKISPTTKPAFTESDTKGKFRKRKKRIKKSRLGQSGSDVTSNSENLAQCNSKTADPDFRDVLHSTANNAVCDKDTPAHQGRQSQRQVDPGCVNLERLNHGLIQSDARCRHNPPSTPHSSAQLQNSRRSANRLAKSPQQQPPSRSSDIHRQNLQTFNSLTNHAQPTHVRRAEGSQWAEGTQRSFVMQRMRQENKEGSLYRSNSDSLMSISSSSQKSSDCNNVKSESLNKDIQTAEYRRGHRNIRVFLTYAKDNRRHVQRILNLFKCLTSNGFSCSMDMKEQRLLLPDNLQSYDDNGRKISPTEEWFVNRYDVADFVIVCVSKRYHEKVQESSEDFGRISIDELHTRYIYSRMRQEFVHNDSRNMRFIPVIFSGASETDIPDWLQQKSRIYQWPTQYKDLFWMMIRMMKKRQEMSEG